MARDAFACYLNGSPAQLGKSHRGGPVAQRINFLKGHLAQAPMPSVTSKWVKLFSVTVSWFPLDVRLNISLC